MNLDQFLTPRCTPDNLDTFLVRSAILQALQAALPRLSGTLLDVGSGYMPYRSLLQAPAGRVTHYIGLDLYGNRYQRPDLEWDGTTIPLHENSVDCALATEVFEHCPDPEAVMREIRRVVKAGGVLFFTVPFLWPLHTVPYDEYRYTPFALERHLRNAGFNHVELTAMGGWDTSMAQMIGLWSRRRWSWRQKRHPLGKVAITITTYLAWPLVRGLSWLDKPPQRFTESSMLPGLTGIAA